jgi:putative aldouronate transport system permease protein
MLALPIIQLVIFKYMPMYGVIIGFKDFNPVLGIMDSPWNNFEHFKRLFGSFLFKRVLTNTVEISLLRLVIGFPTTIIFALLLNEVNTLRFKKIVQSISYLPHFLSWVVIASIVTPMLSPSNGIVNGVLALFGIEPISFLTDNSWFRPILIITSTWKGIGWGSIIYLASISSIDTQLYDAADTDGAGRLRKAIHVTIPGILPMIVIMLILNVGNILDAGFDQIFNLYSPLVYETADIIDTYNYRVGIIESKYDYSAAVGLFKNIVGIVFVLGTNIIARKFSDYALW